MKTAVIDNYDSFTYNLVQLLRDLDQRVMVMRNDELNHDALDQSDRIVLSPGPGLPDGAGKLLKVIQQYHHTKPMLGVCLGHQALAAHFGADLVNLAAVHHGVSHEINITEEDPLFHGLAPRMKVARYHSWVVSPNLPDELIPLAEDREGQVMAFRHKSLPLRGVQFHPESILTPSGAGIMSNFIHQCT